MGIQLLNLGPLHKSQQKVPNYAEQTDYGSKQFVVCVQSKVNSGVT